MIAKFGNFEYVLAEHYRFEDELGRGAMGTVYRAMDVRLGRRVAIKMLHPVLTNELGVARFQSEIRIAAGLHHANIVGVHDSGEADGRMYYVMDYLGGETLRDRLQREKQLSVDDALAIVEQVAEGLQYAHDHAVVHRDVKPENIILAEGRACVVDFGLARALGDAKAKRLTASGISVGTPHYLSPEQASAEREVGPPADQYALACVLYEMLVGEPPFTGPTATSIATRHISEAPRPLRLRRPKAPRRVESAVMRALEKVPADRFRSIRQFATALRAVPELGLQAESELANTHDGAKAGVQSGSRSDVPDGKRRRRAAAVIGVVVICAAVIGAGVVWLPRPVVESLDDNLVAVAPFDVYDPRYALWREGFLDVLSSSLDGAGRLRTVSPTVVAHRWRGPGQRSSALALASQTHARYVVIGRFLEAGSDSIRATATILDARTGHELVTIDVRTTSDRPDKLADSLGVRVVRELGESTDHRTREASLGAASLPALKAYLQGEYYLRRTQWDSAADSYALARSLDSNFALANWRMKTAVWFRSWGPDSAGDTYALLAGRLNHGLAPRESLLIVVDSLWASLASSPDNTWPRIRRLSATLDDAVRRYPDDPWIWYKVGEARFHLPIGLEHPLSEHLAAFDKAISLDSGFALAYVSHAVELALVLDEPARAIQYAQQYHRAALPGVEDSAAMLTERLLDSTASRTRATVAVLDRASADVLYRVSANLGMWFDGEEASVQTARRLARATTGSARFLDRDTRQLRLAHALSVRGHLTEAWRQLDNGASPPGINDGTVELFTDLAVAGAVPAPVADSVFAHGMSYSPRGTVFALRWYSQRRDTAALSQAARAFRVWSLQPGYHDLAEYGTRAVRAYLALAKGDTLGALPMFAELTDSLCADCYADWLTRASLLSATGQWKPARLQLERVLTYAWILPTYPVASLGLGRVAERLGDVDLARRSYTIAVAAWEHGDASVQAGVAEAKAALRRLEHR